MAENEELATLVVSSSRGDLTANGYDRWNDMYEFLMSSHYSSIDKYVYWGDVIIAVVTFCKEHGLEWEDSEGVGDEYRD